MFANIIMSILMIRAFIMASMTYSALNSPHELIRLSFKSAKENNVTSFQPYIWMICFCSASVATIVAVMADSNITSVMYVVTLVMTLIEAYIMMSLENIVFNEGD